MVRAEPPVHRGRAGDGQVLLQDQLTPNDAGPPRARGQRLRLRRHDALRRLVLAARARRRRRPRRLGDAPEAHGDSRARAPRGEGEDGEWTAETTMETTETAANSGSGNVTAGRLGRGGRRGSEGTRSQGGYSGASGSGGEEELQDPWALPQSKKGGSSRWS
ncbi:amidophosphoribosyltransferase [Apiospora arundinis]